MKNGTFELSEEVRKKRTKLQIKMIEHEMLQGELAKSVGLTVVQVNRIVNGKSKGSMTFWEKAAAALGCQVADIL